jgi:DNA-binding FadR family transcriptional regulator
MPVPPVERGPSLTQRAIDVLRAEIVSGAWPVGTKIPTEPELVERLGIARNGLREAVRSLAHTGLLEVRQGSGTYVRATSELTGIMSRRFAASDPAQVAEFRTALESAAAGLAARRRDPDDLRRLDRAVIRRERAWRAGNPEQFAEADATLRSEVVAASGNELLIALYADLAPVFAASAQADGADEVPVYLDRGALVAAIRDGDVAAAAHEAATRPLGRSVPRPRPDRTANSPLGLLPGITPGRGPSPAP